ncbi:MAG: trigger factor [Candidatus Margulisbacteria bacterium]|nr:trigger factor [Candidatus Margulisiibacteriota bacterium]
MKVENLKRQGNLVSFDVEENYIELEPFVDKKYKELVQKVKIPGFRPGKAPKGTFITHYGYERLANEAFMDMLNEIYPKIIAEHKIDVIDFPSDIKVIQLEQSKPIKVSIAVEVKPDIKLSKYKGLKLEKEAVKVNKEDVENEIKSFLEGYATYEDVHEGTAKDNDIVTLDVEAKVDDEIYDKWTKQSDIYKVGTGSISKEYDDNLTGMQIGDSKEFVISFGQDDKVDEKIAGKAVNFKVKLEKIKVKKVPELTDDFVAGKTDKMTVDDFRKATEEKLRAGKEVAADNKLKEDVGNWIIENVEGEIPEVMIKKETDYMLRRMELGLRQYNMPLSTYLQITKKSLDDLRKDYRDEAQKNVKYLLGLEFIAKEENVDATEEEIREEIEENVKSEKDEQKKEQLRKQLEQLRENIRETILHRKVIDYLINNAKVKRK